MMKIKTCFPSKYFKKVLFSVVFVVVFYSFNVIHWQNNREIISLINGQKIGWPITNKCDNEITRFLNQEIDVFQTLTLVQLLEYLRWSNQTACERVGYYGGNILNFGNESLVDGQKAICLDIGKAPQKNNCIVYSIGINNEWSFDEAMETYGCQVDLFDSFDSIFIFS